MAVAGPREFAVIDCVAIFYEEGKGGENYRKKNKFRCRIDKGEKRIVKFRESICEFAGIKSTAKTLGLGDNLRVELNRETKKDGRTERIAIETDQQLELELPPILTCCDKLQLIIYPIRTVFSSKCPKIVIKDTNSSHNPPTPSSKPCDLLDQEKATLNEELLKRRGSKLVRCDTHTHVKVRGKESKLVEWPWKICCGNCRRNVQLRYDADVKGRISYFDRHHYSTCSTAKNNGEKEKSQKTLQDMFTRAKKRKAESEKKSKRQKRAEDVDSDIDVSDCEKTYETSGSESEYDSCDGDGDSSEGECDENGQNAIRTKEHCSCIEEIHTDDEKECVDEDDHFTVYVGIEQADPLCAKIHDLLQRGKISKDRIFYKYLHDVVEIMYNPFHEYDREVVEFFNTITYLGGKRTACFIRGPMNLGDGRNSQLEKKMNLGGPSESVCAKHQAGYTPDSGVIKPLSLGHLELLKNSQAKRLIETPQLTIIPCALANDGTALKPAIEFDARLKENVGLKTSVDIKYVKENPSPSPAHLKENIITEALVSSLTSLDNYCSLPVAVDYSTQSGKTGQAMINLFEEHIKTLQSCEFCQKKALHRRHIITSENVNCTSFCEVCYQSKTVCEDCKLLGQVSHIPSLRFCDTCRDNNSNCFRRVVMVVCSDCETGNKTAFETIKAKLEEANEDPALAFLSILPDCPHVGKSIKAAFSNWWLKCKDERINLGLVRTLRNRSDKATKDKFRKLIPKNDHVKNKDRQDPSAVLTLTSDRLTDELKNTGYVCHTIVPELDKYSADNQNGMYPSPISVVVPSYGWIAFLSFDVKRSLCNLFKARLHSPVDQITAIGKNLKARDIHSSDGIIFLTADNGPIKTVEFVEGSISMIVKHKKKEDLVRLADKMHVPSSGTMAEITQRLKAHSEKLATKYSRNSVKVDEIHFWDCEKQPSFEAMACADSELFYAAECAQKAIVSFQVEKDGIGLKGLNLQIIIQYSTGWHKVNSMCLCDSNIYTSHSQGISKVSLESGECMLLVELLNQPCVLTKFGTGILFTNQKRASVWQLSPRGDVRVFAGSDSEEGSVDGLAKNCRLKQPIGICTEFDSVVYICDAQTNSIKICSKLTECSHFLKIIGALYDAFSVHSKGATYKIKSADEALSLVRQCKVMLNEITADIRDSTGISRTLNGPQGHVSAKTVNSVEMIEWGLQRLFSNLSKFDYKATNLLSCMTLDVENCHSTVHIKQAILSMLEYCRSFGLTMKESIKRTTDWAAYYHTSRRSWYPKPEETVSLSQVPTIAPLPAVEMPQADCDLMRNWASSYGAAVRQRTVRQETTMAKHGTLPEFIYQRQCVASDEPVTLTTFASEQAEGPEKNSTLLLNEKESDDEMADEFDSSSDEEVEAEDAEGGNSLLQGEIGSSASFLLGARSRFGRVVRFNNRFLS